MDREGILMIVSGPSGSGKGTVVKEVVKEDNYALSISVTTRRPRPGENEGEHYFFKTKDEFKKLIEEDKLLEWARFCDNYYGTPLHYVQQQMKEGKNVILEIEVDGALQVKGKYPDAVLIFLMPPTIEELRQRLDRRGTESPEIIERRIRRAETELDLLSKYDYVVINDDINEAKEDILKIVDAEKMSVKRNMDIKRKFKGEI